MILKENLKNITLDEKEDKLFVYIAITIMIMSIIFTASVFFSGKSSQTHLESTIGFIKNFNFILSVLAYISCLVSYNRLKNDSIFIISLMYMALSICILYGHIDYFTFYYDEINLSNYIVLSTSIIRMMLLIITIYPKAKVRKLIVNNKIASSAVITVLIVGFGFLEKSLKLGDLYHSDYFFVIYNIFLMLVYIVVAMNLLIKGLIEKEYIFVVLSSSIFMLALKAVYAIYGIRKASLDVKLMSVAITYLCFCIVIIGSFIELYLYISRTKVLNNKFSVFYNLAEKNKHSFMFICNIDGKVLYANKNVKEFYSETDDVPIGYFDEILKSRMTETGKRKEIIDALNKKGVWRGIIASKEDNKTIDLSAQLINSYDGSKEIAVTFMDITEEIQTELELEKLKIYDKEKTEFIANMSHELKTPLNIFYSTIQLLDSSAQGNCSDFKMTYVKYKKSLHLNCKRMIRLINNMVDISKIDMDIVKANFNNYDIVYIAEEVTMSVVDYAMSKSINILFDTTDEEHIIKCDAAMIERALLNLLSNAIKFTNAEKNIYVNVRVEDDYVKIEVKDEGIGISKSSKQHIFERFVQVDKSFTRLNEGSGIGLSIVKSLVSLHNGKVYVDSNENEGSTFTIALPNVRIEDADMKIYNKNNDNTELELSDIYEVVN